MASLGHVGAWTSSPGDDPMTFDGTLTATATDVGDYKAWVFATLRPNFTSPLTALAGATIEATGFTGTVFNLQTSPVAFTGGEVVIGWMRTGATITYRVSIPQPVTAFALTAAGDVLYSAVGFLNQGGGLGDPTTIPAGTASGDRLYLVAYARDSGGGSAYTTPSGWTPYETSTLATDTSQGGYIRQTVWTKTAGSSEPTPSLTLAASMSTQIWHVIGHKDVTVVDHDVAQRNGPTTGTFPLPNLGTTGRLAYLGTLAGQQTASAVVAPWAQVSNRGVTFFHPAQQAALGYRLAGAPSPLAPWAVNGAVVSVMTAETLLDKVDPVIQGDARPEPLTFVGEIGAPHIGG